MSDQAAIFPHAVLKSGEKCIFSTVCYLCELTLSWHFSNVLYKHALTFITMNIISQNKATLCMLCMCVSKPCSHGFIACTDYVIKQMNCCTCGLLISSRHPNCSLYVILYNKLLLCCDGSSGHSVHILNQIILRSCMQVAGLTLVSSNCHVFYFNWGSSMFN